MYLLNFCMIKCAGKSHKFAAKKTDHMCALLRCLRKLFWESYRSVAGYYTCRFLERDEGKFAKQNVNVVTDHVL